MNDGNSLRPFRLWPIANLELLVIAVQYPSLTISLSAALLLSVSHSLTLTPTTLFASLFFARAFVLILCSHPAFTYLMSLTLSLWLCFYQNVKSFLVNFQNVTDIKGDFCVLYLLGTYAEAHLQISHRFLSKMFTSKEET